VRVRVCLCVCVLQSKIKEWMEAPVDPALSLPPPNPFIATDFSLRHPQVAPPPDEDLTHLAFNDPATRARVAGACLLPPSPPPGGGCWGIR
jgi:hypothetical protein